MRTLGITGVNQTANDAAVASLVVSYSANGGAYIPLTDMLVAEAGNCNDVLTGDATGEINAACSNGRSGGAFAAAAVDTSAVLTLNAGQTLDFESTLTVYADPANFDSIDSSLDGLLLPELSLSAPNILVGDDDAEPTPEPATLLLVGAGPRLGFGLLHGGASRAKARVSARRNPARTGIRLPDDSIR